MIGFVDTSCTQLGTTGNYSAIADLQHTLEFSVTHTLGSTIFTSRILETDFNIVIIPVSLSHTLQISLYYVTHNNVSSLSDLQLSTELSRFLHQLPTANSGILNPVLCCNCQLSRCHLLSVIVDCRLQSSKSKTYCD
jgi:hypothetical protein